MKKLLGDDGKANECRTSNSFTPYLRGALGRLGAWTETTELNDMTD